MEILYWNAINFGESIPDQKEFDLCTTQTRTFQSTESQQNDESDPLQLRPFSVQNINHMHHGFQMERIPKTCIFTIRHANAPCEIFLHFFYYVYGTG